VILDAGTQRNQHWKQLWIPCVSISVDKYIFMILKMLLLQGFPLLFSVKKNVAPTSGPKYLLHACVIQTYNSTTVNFHYPCHDGMAIFLVKVSAQCTSGISDENLML
jgi:hypothetical protein